MNRMLKMNPHEKHSFRMSSASTMMLLGGAVLLLTSVLSVEAKLAGHWEAEMVGDGGQKIQVSLDLNRNAQSEWIASMGLPAENLTGLVVQEVTVEGPSVRFVAVELMMTPFDLVLGPDGTLKGTITGPAAQPVEFRRTGEAKVELIPASPAVSPQLEGDWEGTLPLPGRPVVMAFHFENQTDKTVTATFSTDNGPNLPLNDVKQTGRKVELGLRVAHGHFKGTLNEEGTELAGEFSHGEHGMPLTLRKQ